MVDVGGPGMLPSLTGGNQRELLRAVELARFHALEHLGRLNGSRSRESNRQSVWGEGLAKCPHTADSCAQISPEVGDVVADWRGRSHACDNYCAVVEVTHDHSLRQRDSHRGHGRHALYSSVGESADTLRFSR